MCRVSRAAATTHPRFSSYRGLRSSHAAYRAPGANPKLDAWICTPAADLETYHRAAIAAATA